MKNRYYVILISIISILFRPTITFAGGPLNPMPSVFLFDDGESTNTILCHGGTGNIPLTIFPNEGFTYEWRNSGGTLVSTDRDLMSVPADTYTIKLFKNGNNSSWNFTLTDPSAMNITLTPSLFTGGFNISYSGGHDGTIACTVQGGAPSYYYQWSNGNYLPSIGNLYAGTYSVTVTDAMGCTATSSSMTLTAPTPIHVTPDTSSHHNFAVSCNGGNDGAINLTVSGGVSPYSYNWNDGIYTKDRTSLAAGTHTVIVDDANPGARDTLHITLHQPSAISITMASPLHPNGYNTSCYNCKDGKITASASGGISGYTYLWNTGKIGNEIDSLIKGIDTVTVTDNNGCKMKKSFEVTGDIEGWKIGGNANIDTNMQFMGTKDNKDLILKTNNIKRMTIKASGKIEMNSPLKISHDTTSTSNYRVVYAHDDGTLDYVGTEEVNANPCLARPTIAWFNFDVPSTCSYLNYVDVFLKPGLRNVGIGTERPLAKLHIDHNDQKGGIILNRISTSTSHSEIKFNQNGIQKWAIGNDLTETGVNNFFIWNHSRYLAGLNGTAFFIDSTNNVGIDKVPASIPGSLSLPTKLDVNGNILAGSSTESRISCFSSSPLKSSVWSANSNYGYGMGVNGLGHIYGNFNNPVSIMTFTNAGFVGIGTNFNINSISSPRNSDYVLYVEGSIAAREIKVTAINFPDYVFSKNHKLLTLFELEEFINNNKHLPGIPTAKEVEANKGFEVGEMQQKLLEKIEEQTLYIIGLQKQIDEMKNEIKNFK